MEVNKEESEPTENTALGSTTRPVWTIHNPTMNDSECRFTHT